MALSQPKGFIIRRGHRVVFIRYAQRALNKKRAVRKRRRPQPHRRLV